MALLEYGNSRDLRLFSESNVFCFLFSKSRHVLLLNASTSRIKIATGNRFGCLHIVTYFPHKHC